MDFGFVGDESDLIKPSAIFTANEVSIVVPVYRLKPKVIEVITQVIEPSYSFLFELSDKSMFHEASFMMSFFTT